MGQLLKHFLFLIIIFMSVNSFALPDDSNKAMQIHASSTLFNFKKGFNVYDGDVKVTQGSTRLTADKLTTQNNDTHKMEEAIAYGFQNPAHYWTLPKAGDVEFHAQAKVITFYPLKSLVKLEGDVVITQGNNSFHGPIILYNIKDQTVTSPASNKGRATIVIDPNQLK
ncbi:MAG: lipopolysaccharide transport periplasmic protein LptA [Gammaproteobacteria bacterium]|nr:lipopolysaccharide transport periplasmic protein LptA [Gammaproteobacteria bacterium]